MLSLHYGCKVNQYETNAIAENFIEANYKIVPFDEKADVYVVNTCTVTNMSDRKSRQILRRTKQLNENAILVATGCYAEIAKQELSKIDEIDLVLGNNEKNKIVEFVEEFEKDKKKKCIVSDVNKQAKYIEFGSIAYTEKTRATIKVQDGCNNFCSYCLIPYARGRIRSRKPENVLNEIRKIVKDEAIKEVVITGIQVTAYGQDLNQNYYLIDLLEDINKIEGLERIRLGSLEPNIITEEFLKRLSKLKKICNHFHLSLQSGCDETLKRMNRKYTTTEFRKIVELIRRYFKDVALTTDIIVGFPGETEEEFKTTYNFLDEIKFAKMHVFPYSMRKGTVAAKMKNQVDMEIKKERTHKLIELSNKNENEFLSNMIGKSLDVLFEEYENDYSKGHTTNYILVKVKDKNLENKIKKISIKRVNELALIGNLE